MVTTPRRPKLRVAETPIVKATNETLQSLSDLGRLEAVDAAEVALLRAIAVDLDALPADSRSKPPLIRQMSLLLRSLRGTARDSHDLDALLSRLATSGESEMGDAAY